MIGQLWWQRFGRDEWQSSDWRFRIRVQADGFCIYDDHQGRWLDSAFDSLQAAQLHCNGLWRKLIGSTQWIHMAAEGQTLCGDAHENALVAHEDPSCPLCLGMINHPLETP